MADEREVVTWRDARWEIVGCWVVCAVGGVLVALFDFSTSLIAYLAVGLLAEWFRPRRDWPAGVLAACAGAGVLFPALDTLRPVTPRALADGLAIALGATTGVLVFTLVGRARTARGRAR
ncbi:hypothetical protein [Streptomyces sp. NPDC056144]|uniref:hypothetical protein n=1 Tax=unclassified Streptomyces TaxID=2593676 RepID=UPI0035DE1E09